jgi:hypothetical protein
LNYIDREKKNWASKPTILFGDGLQDSIVLIFGKPKTAVFAHMDSIGYTVRYGNQLVRIGSPHNKDGDLLVGEDQKGNIECEFKLGKDGELTYDNIRPIETGTTLTYKPDFRETDDFVQCCYLDNRLGIYVALKLADIRRIAVENIRPLVASGLMKPEQVAEANRLSDALGRNELEGKQKTLAEYR